ncbi:MAG TPA: serine acetyltransferase, partial [Polyangiaceae bacterium LLY-WYZ-15_(1-7)]|nr:serine acetyltransferase [Polyangiaceae bacterium LLY-WYZ-15_(1-7)]
ETGRITAAADDVAVGETKKLTAAQADEIGNLVEDDEWLGLGVELVTGTRLHRETRVGAAPHFIHGRNVRIHPDAVIGDRVGIMHDVTIGTRNDIEGAPIIEDDAFIGAGAKVLGPVRVGKGAIVAANSLVVTDVPPGATAMGVPARALPQRKKPRPG